MKKILVTGATGFLGNYVIENLLTRNLKIVASSFDEEKAKFFSWYGKTEYIPLDILKINPEINYWQFFDNPDILIHLAWSGLPNYKDEIHLRENLPAQRTFLSNLIKNGLKNLTVTGTCLEYGLKEGQLSEMSEIHPIVGYAIAKNYLREFLEDEARSRDVSLKWVRLFYVYGKGQSPTSLFSQLESAVIKGETVFNMSKGDQERDFIHVNEAAERIVDIALQNKVSGIINCGSGRPVKVIDFVKDYLEKNGKKIQLNTGFYPYNDYEPMSFWADTQKLNKLTK